jgi:hypothetical protein
LLYSHNQVTKITNLKSKFRCRTFGMSQFDMICKHHALEMLVVLLNGIS